MALSPGLPLETGTQPGTAEKVSAGRVAGCRLSATCAAAPAALGWCSPKLAPLSKIKPLVGHGWSLPLPRS